MRAVVLTFDRLPTRFLGCYGSEDTDTPNFDRLAAQSVVFDSHFAENVDSAAAGHAWWTGRYQFPCPPDVQRSFRPAIAALESAGVRTVLISEPQSSSGVACPPPFGETIEVTGRDGFDAHETEAPISRLVSAAEERLEQLVSSGSEPALLWLRSRGVPAPWIPPRPFLIDALARAGLLEDEADEREESSRGTGEAATFVADIEAVIAALDARLAAPQRIRDDTGDPGEFHVLVETARAVYAGSVALLDRSLGRLRTAVEHACRREPLLFIVTAALGQSLGESVWLGERASEAERGGRLVDELVHTPLFVQVLPDGIAGRSSALVQTVDVVPTLLEWFGIDSAALDVEGRSLLPLLRGEAGPRTESAVGHAASLPRPSGDPPPKLAASASVGRREFVVLGDGPRQRAVRSEDFLLVSDGPGGRDDAANPPRLYVEPDDRWQINDVAAQSPDEVARLEALLADFLASC